MPTANSDPLVPGEGAEEASTELRPPPPLAQRIALLISLLAAAGLAFLLGARLRESATEQARREAERARIAREAGRAPEVAFVQATSATYTPLIVLQGTLEPIQAADLGFEVGGRVARVEVALGQTVRSGDVLVVLDRASVSAQTAQTEAAIAVARANVEMLRDRVALLRQLTASGAAPERELTTAEQQLAVAEAQLAQVQVNRQTVATVSADHVLRAPFGGVVTRVPSGVGAVVGPGQVLVRIEDLSALRLRTTVSQSELEALSVGATVVLEGVGGADGRPVTGTVRTVVRSLDPQTRRAPVEVLFSNPDGRLVANAFVRGRLVVGSPRPALRLPATARRSDGTVLVIGTDGRVEARPVEAQADVDGSWLVFAGIGPDDRVVLRPAGLRIGQVVVPTPAATTPPSPPRASREL
jgi:RND family efflux transporter MFP subunit